jgi:hypothetical protein
MKSETLADTMPILQLAKTSKPMKQMPKLRRCLPLLALLGSLQITLGYYDPAAQRWINRDPIGERGGANAYAVAANAPITLVDPQGLKPESCEKICKKAIEDPTISKVGGAGVICYEGTKCACLFAKHADCPELDQIVKEHEEQHLEDVQCTPCPSLQRPDFTDPSKVNERECKLRKADIPKLFLAAGQATGRCKTLLQENARAQMAWVSSNCR